MTSAQRSILAVAMLTQGIAVGLTVAIVPIFLEPLELAFDAPRTVIAGGQILIMLTLTVGSIVTGIVLDRGHVRAAMLVGACGMISAQVLASVAPNLWVLGLAAGLAGFSIPPLGPLTAGKLITHYFDQGRGRAMGLMSVGPPLGSGIFAALAGWLLLTTEWRGVFQLFAVIAAVVVIPLIILIVPRHFDDVPAASDSSSDPGSAVASTGESDEGATAGQSMADVVRSPAFLWAGGMFAIVAGVTTGWTVHIAAYLGAVGLDEATRSNVLAVQFWMGVPGSIVFGVLADRIGLKTLLFGSIVTTAACYGAFSFEPAPVLVTGLSALVGFSMGGVIPLYMMLLGKTIGPESLGRAMGLSNLMMLPVMSIAVLVAASLFESNGNYRFALTVLAIALLGGLICLLGAHRSSRVA